MSVTTEPEMLNVTGGLTTNAAANTQKTQTLVAAPAAGRRHRVYVVTISFDLTTGTPAAGTVISAKVNGGGSSLVVAIDYPNHPSKDLVVPNGFPLPTANAFRLLDASSGATVPYMYGAEYVTEDA